MLGETLENINVELDEIIDRLDTLVKNTDINKNNRQNLSVASSYIGAAIRVIDDVSKKVK